MPGILSKEPLSKEEKDRQANVIYLHMALNIVGICTVLQVRPNLILNAVKGDTAKMATFLTSFSSCVGLLEFFLNPTAGKLSDQYGRRKFLIASPTINCLLKMMVALNPSLAMIGIERVIDGAVTTLAGSTTCSAMLSDLYSGKDLATAYATLGSAAGLGVIGGAFVSGRLLAAGASPRQLFGFASLVAGAQVVICSTYLSETLAEDKRRPFDWSRPVANPLAFLQLFTKTPALRKLVTVAGLQCMPEGKNISDLMQVCSV
jgi:MFS family permease